MLPAELLPCAFVKQLETEPFSAFTFSPVAISVYQARKLRYRAQEAEYWSFAP